MRLPIKLVILCVSFFSILHAEWDPVLFLNENPGVQNVLNDPKFSSLKQKVLTTLKDSWCSEEKTQLLMDLVLLTKPKVCVEIGAFTGSSVLPVAATLKHLNRGSVYAVDAWSNAVATRYMTNDDPNKNCWSTINMEAIYKSFNKLIKTWSLKRFCTPIRAPSENAVYQIPNHIDFLHLDGDYSEIGSMRDVRLYLPKVKSGGYILFSNFYTMINREQPKIKAFCLLYEECEIVLSIERDNAILFKKK